MTVNQIDINADNARAKRKALSKLKSENMKKLWKDKDHKEKMLTKLSTGR